MVPDKDCDFHNNLGHLNSDHANDDQVCKSWCAQRDDCAGFRSTNNDCYFKRATCLNSFYDVSGGSVYLKVVD